MSVATVGITILWGKGRDQSGCDCMLASSACTSLNFYVPHLNASGSLVMFAAMRLASSRINKCAAARLPGSSSKYT